MIVLLAFFYRTPLFSPLLFHCGWANRVFCCCYCRWSSVWVLRCGNTVVRLYIRLMTILALSRTNQRLMRADCFGIWLFACFIVSIFYRFTPSMVFFFIWFQQQSLALCQSRCRHRHAAYTYYTYTVYNCRLFIPIYRPYHFTTFVNRISYWRAAFQRRVEFDNRNELHSSSWSPITHFSGFFCARSFDLSISLSFSSCGECVSCCLT